MPDLLPVLPVPPNPPGNTADPLRGALGELEARFLSEMLKAAGFAEPLEGFGGGVGEDQFSSFLRDMHSGALARAGGIGLAESIYRAMMAGSGRG